MMSEEEGTLRLLTPGEIRLAKSVYGNSICYHKVWIHHDSYLPFGWQSKRYAMTPNGELYFREWYRDDYSQCPRNEQHLFIHEMAHVWQRERGMQVKLRGLFSWVVDYGYRLDGRKLCQYPLEQQAQIIADNFVFEQYGFREWLLLKTSNTVTMKNIIKGEDDLRPLYQIALKNFPGGL
ncbi:type IV secretion protein Rhs [Cronobacter malonaticus]